MESSVNFTLFANAFMKINPFQGPVRGHDREAHMRLPMDEKFMDPVLTSFMMQRWIPSIQEGDFGFAVLCFVTQSCLTLCNPIDCSLPGSSAHGDSPGKKAWCGLPCPPPGHLPNPGNQTWVSRITGRLFTIWATREAFGFSGYLLIVVKLLSRVQLFVTP